MGQRRIIHTGKKAALGTRHGTTNKSTTHKTKNRNNTDGFF